MGGWWWPAGGGGGDQLGMGVVGGWLRDRQGVEFGHCPRLVAGLWVCCIFGYTVAISFFPHGVLGRKSPKKVSKFGFCSQD